MSTSSYLERRTRHTPNSMRAKSVSNMMYSQKRKSIFFQCIYAYFYCYLQLATKVNRFSHRWMQKWRIICKRNYHDLERSSYGCCWRSSGPGTSWRENIYMYRLTKCYNIPDGSSTSPTWLELEEHSSLMTMTASSNTTPQKQQLPCFQVPCTAGSPCRCHVQCWTKCMSLSHAYFHWYLIKSGDASSYAMNWWYDSIRNPSPCPLLAYYKNFFVEIKIDF